MSRCEFDWGEDHCSFEGHCRFQKGDFKECTVNPKDLIEVCPDCYGSIDEMGDCNCWKNEGCYGYND